MSQDQSRRGPAREDNVTLVTPGPAALTEGNDPTSLVGAVLQNYKIVARVAEGGMGVVYRAEHASIGKPAAIKVIKSEYCQNETTMRRFYQEGRLVNQIHHPNIIDIFDFGKLPDGRAFYVMEYLEGESLARRLGRGLMPPEEALPLMKQAAEALRAAHGAGIIHRDLKPENFIIVNDEDGPKLKLLDFGIAKLVGMEDIQDKLTKTGNIIGTPHYMSPEQINGANIDARSDIYSLGMVFYEMLSGQVPFGQRPVGQILAAQILGDTGEISQNLQILTIPEGFKSLVKKSIATRPLDRYQDMNALLSDLAALAEGKEIKAPPPRSDTKMLPSEKQRSPLLWVGVGLLVAALGGGVTWLLLPEKGQSTTAPAASQEAASIDSLRAASLELLKKSLTAEGPGLRSAAVKALGELGDIESRARIEALLVASEDLEVRVSAALALANLGEKSSVSAIQGVRAAAPSYVGVAFDAALFALGALSLDGLTPALKGSPEEQLIAARAISSSAKPEVARELLSVIDLSTQKPLEQFTLLAERTRLGDKASQEALSQKLSSGEEAEKILAAYAFAKIGSDLGRDSLTRGLSATQPELAILAASGLLSIGDTTGASLLQSNLTAKSSNLRRRSAEALALTQDEAAALQLAPLLEDKDPQVSVSAAASILSIVGLGESWLSSQSVAWDNQAQGSSDPKVKARYFARLGRLPAEQALPILQAAYPAPEREVNLAIVNAISRIASEQQSEEANKFLAALDKDKSKEGHIAGLVALSKTSVDAKAALDALLSDSAKLNEEKAIAVQAADEQDNIEVLLAALRDKAFAIKFEAALALANRGDASGVAALQEAAAGKDGSTKNLAKIALAQLGQPVDAPPDLEALLSSENERERLAAVKAAQGAPEAQQKALLRKATQSPDPAVRIAAIEASAKKGDLGPAKLALKDKDPTVKSAAAALLQAGKTKTPTSVAPPQTKPTKAACGNGVQEGDEKCDDGNRKDGDGCDSNCTPTGCGNGIVTKGEECDETNREKCTAACTDPLSVEKKSDEANKQMLAAKSAFNLGQFSKARGLFKSANGNVPQPDIQWWYAECDRLLAPSLKEPQRTNTLKIALGEYQKFLKSNPNHKDAAKAKKYAEEIQERLEE